MITRLPMRWGVAPRAMLYLAVCAVAAGGSFAAICAAQDDPETSPREMIYAYKVWKLTDMLDLSEDQMPGFFAKIKGMEDKEFEISEGERDAAREIGHMLARGNVGDRELEQALRHYEEVREARRGQLDTMRREATAMLTLRQRCKYVVFEERFRDEMRQLIGRAREIRCGGAPDVLRGGGRGGR